MSNQDKLQTAIQQLGQYVGQISQNEFMSRLLDVAAASPEVAGSPSTTVAEFDAATGGTVITEDDAPFNKVLNGLLGLTDGGTTIEKFTNDVWKFTDGGESDIVAKITADTGRLFTITHHTHHADENFVNDITIGQIAGDETLNSLPSTKNTPGISIIQMHDPALNFSNRDVGAVGTFMNCIPTIEMSKCQPFVDIKVFTKFPKTETVGGDLRIGEGISLLRFLKGKAVIAPDDDALLAMAQSVPVGFDAGFTVKDEEKSELTGDDEYIEMIGTVAGMEIFTTPQTLVDADNDFIDTAPAFHPDGTPRYDLATRGAATIDKFRPFMTLKSLNLNVAPTKGMMSTKTGDIAFVLHDRSRLGDIAQFVRPSSVGKDVELLIDFGWTHPEADQDPPNYFADLIQAMRCKQKFGVMNSTLSFNNVGEVDIKCKLFTKGSRETTNLLITSKEITDQLDAIQKILQHVRDIKKRMRADLGENEELIGGDTLGKANSASAIMGLKSEDLRKITDLCASIKNNSGTLGELGSSLGEALGRAESMSTMIEDWFSKSDKSGVFDKINPANKSPDPFIKEQLANKIYVQGKHNDDANPYRGKEHVSFAKIALLFMALPLSDDEKFDEIQMIFYPFNGQSGFAAGLDIGSFPINVAKFKEIMLDEFQKRPSMTVAQFIGRMNSNFFANMACDGYGYADIYDRDTESGKASLKGKYKDSQANQVALTNAKEKVLEDAYGPDADAKFKRPQVQMFLESTSGTIDPEDATWGPGSTILRMHFFDKTMNSYSGFSAMWDSMRSSMMSTINRSAMNLTTSITNASDSDDKGTANQLADHSAAWEKQWAVIEALDIIEVVDDNGEAQSWADSIAFAPNSAGQEQSSDEADDKIARLTATPHVRIKGGPQALRYMMQKNIPTIKYGTSTSAVINASLSTKSDSKVATIHMTTQKEAGKRAPGGHDDGLPLRTFPAQLSIETFGCPLINFGQQFFVDFQTGTSLDDVYVVTKLDHSLSPAEFKTKITLTPMMKFGQFQSLIGNVGKLMAEIGNLSKTKDES